MANRGRYKLAKQTAVGAVFAEATVEIMDGAVSAFSILPAVSGGRNLPPSWARAATAGAKGAQQLLGGRQVQVQLVGFRGLVVDTTCAAVALATMGAVLRAADEATADPEVVATALCAHDFDRESIPTIDDLVQLMTIR